MMDKMNTLHYSYSLKKLQGTGISTKTEREKIYSLKILEHFFATSQTVHLLLSRPTDGAARIFFLPPYAAAGIRTHVSKLAPLCGTLIQDRFIN